MCWIPAQLGIKENEQTDKEKLQLIWQDQTWIFLSVITYPKSIIIAEYMEHWKWQ